MSARLRLLLALFTMGMNHAGLSADADSDSFSPKTYGIGHYENIWKRSPFIVETVNTVTSPGLAAKYGLVGLASLGGSPVVFLWDKNETDPGKNRFMVSKGKPDTRHNIEIVSVSVDKDPRKSTAVIKQGSEQASLQFDASSLPPTGPVNMPGMMVSPSANYVRPFQGGAIPPPPTGINSPPGLNPAVRINRTPIQGSYPIPPAGLNNPNPAGEIPPPPGRRIIRPKIINVN